jgi:hypothetical protein
MLRLPHRESPSPVALAAAAKWNDAGHRIPVRQAFDLRDLAALLALELHDQAAPDLASKALRAQALRNLTNVWSDALESIRILRGRPLPGSLRPERKPSKRKPRSAGPVGDAKSKAPEQPQPPAPGNAT